MKGSSMKDTDKCLDSQLWHACAGGMVRMPAMNSRVYYFPQGHAEHSQGVVDFGNLQRIPPFILCQVTTVKFMADLETDEVFAKIRMAPIRSDIPDYIEDEGLVPEMNEIDVHEKPTSFAKTLTQSDANNGGGFSVPRYCAETIFPRLDYTADPPVQNVIAKDVHGKVWKFRHIYRGTPRRHLLTTGWSNFVNQKKLVAGDSIVFLRAENGDLCVGIRRAKRGGVGDSPATQSAWSPQGRNGASSYGGLSSVLTEEESKLMRGNDSHSVFSRGIRGRGQVRADSVVEAATHAANGQPFEVVYYPRASTPEFCVKAAAVKAALRIQWYPGMRFKMAFETEDSSRISWFMGTISSVQVADPIRWPNSPWRLLQVTWDEPDLLQNVKRVNPWLVELALNMPAINLGHLPPPIKKQRFLQQPPFEGQFPVPMVSGTPSVPRGSPYCCFSDSAPAGIQGARHAQFDISLSDLHLNKLQTGLFHAGFHRLDHATPPSRISTGVIVGNPTIQDKVSCLLTSGHPSQGLNKSCNGKLPQLVLFGQPILTEQQISLCKSETMIFDDATGTSSSDGNLEKATNVSDGSGFAINHKGPLEAFAHRRDHRALELIVEAEHCKVFMESEDVGHSLDLSVFGSYEELYERLGDMFGIEKSEMITHMFYKDAAGALKHAGDEPFSNFMKTARRLTILTDSGNATQQGRESLLPIV
ncbi:auxin response factor 18 [Musa acuminata AAA Group]|uniref:auxin response factor 18 n=1 Tax=Musa acuminata AAA Group TaxID=214697 RepID=UPI0031DAD90E